MNINDPVLPDTFELFRTKTTIDFVALMLNVSSISQLLVHSLLYILKTLLLIILLNLM